MFAVYATHAAPDDPLSALKVGERPDPDVPEGWVRVKVSHASLNRHDLFTLRGMSGHPEGITYPIILGNDAAGTLDDGIPVVIYPMMGSDDWRGDETLDPKWHPLIERALVWRRQHDEQDDLAETLDFVRFAVAYGLEKCQQLLDG